MLMTTLVSIAFIFGPPKEGVKRMPWENTYEGYTIKKLESVPFDAWWIILKDYAIRQGVRIDDTQKGDFRVYYYDEGYLPHEAFNKRYGG